MRICKKCLREIKDYPFCPFCGAYCVRYAELEQTSEQYHAQQIEPEAMTPQSEAFMEMM